MKRVLRLTGLLAVCALLAFAQEKEVDAEGGRTQLWKWANFVLLAGALGYLIGKNAPAFFQSRSQQINKDIAEAREESRKAEARAAEVDRRLDNLESEIAALRDEAKQQAEAEARRVEQHTADEMARIQSRAEQEISSAGKAARLDLRRYAASLAVGLAEQKIRARLTPEAQDGLVRSFVRNLK